MRPVTPRLLRRLNEGCVVIWVNPYGRYTRVVMWLTHPVPQPLKVVPEQCS